MISQTKKTTFNSFLRGLGSLRIQKRLLKIVCDILFTGLALFTDADATDRSIDEDYLYTTLHPTSSRSQRQIARQPREAQRLAQQMPARSSGETLSYSLSRTQISPPQPTLNHKQTPVKIVQYYPLVPVPRSLPLPLQLSDGNEFYKSAIGNQLQLGTCASFAVVDCLLHAHGKTLSPAYLNVKAKRMYAHDCSNDGLDIGTAMKCAQESGTVMDWVWPYKGYYAEVEEENRSISNNPQPNWDVCIPSPYTDAQDKGLIKFAFKEIKGLFLNINVTGKDLLIKDAILAHKSPVAISVPVGRNKEWQTTGKIRTPLKREEIHDWHAVSICGFNDTTEEFTFKNSWGRKWGTRGFGTISYQYIIAHASEAWIGYGKQLIS